MLCHHFKGSIEEDEEIEEEGEESVQSAEDKIKSEQAKLEDDKKALQENHTMMAEVCICVWSIYTIVSLWRFRFRMHLLIAYLVVSSKLMLSPCNICNAN